MGNFTNWEISHAIVNIPLVDQEKIKSLTFRTKISLGGLAAMLLTFPGSHKNTTAGICSLKKKKNTDYVLLYAGNLPPHNTVG